MLQLRQQQELLQRLAACYYSSMATSTATKRKSVKLHKKQPKENTTPIIACKRKEFNLFGHESAGAKFGTIPLASKGWLHNKSKGDYFIIHPTVSADELQQDMQDFHSFLESQNMKLDSTLLENMENTLDIRQLTEIQKKAIPKIMDSNHVLMAAETGCGKTLAYLVPIVQQIVQRKQSTSATDIKDRELNTPLAIIITPGRELASQIGEVAKKLCTNMNMNVKTILGGNTKRLMMDPEFEDVDILVATLGALSKLITTGIYRTQQVRHIVLDEADSLLDDSFVDKLEHLLKRFPFYNNHMQDHQQVGTQLVLASATMPTNIATSLRNIIDVQTLHEVTSQRLHQLLPHIEQRFKRITKADRPMQLLALVKAELLRKRPILIFSNKSDTSDYVSLFLNNNGVNCLNLNGDMLMKIRLGRFEQYQRGEVDVLSTTDVASRGLDTCRTQHVVNFDFPLHTSDYIHRCGRIGRVRNLEQKCVVTNFISSRREINLVQRIEHTARIGGVLPNVNANIKNLINTRILTEIREQQARAPKKQMSHHEEEEF